MSRMGFLQPAALIALPLIALPILIHLINRYRHRTVPWAAMMFLRRAQRMRRGMARLRHLLILLMRVLALAALIFVISRPLSGGWLGSLGMGRPDATLVLLDRSASMETQDLQAGQSKRTAALRKLTHLLEQDEHGAHLLLIESATGQLHAVDSPSDLLTLPMTAPSATRADIPAMLETALAYLKANRAGRADIWICSDLSENDWDVGSGRWHAVREELAQMEGVHLFLLAYAGQPENNLALRVANVQRWHRQNAAELVLDVSVRSNGSSGTPHQRRRVPITFEVNNVRSVVEVDLDRQGATLQGHRIPIDTELRSGWGSVSLPGDANTLDNRFFFVFSDPPTRRALIVSDDVRNGEAFRRALATPTDPRLQHEVDVVSVDRAAEMDWENTGVLIWHAPLPTGARAAQIEQFVDAGRVVMFFPPMQQDDTALFGTRWGDWQTPKDRTDFAVASWRGDADLLRRVESGDALPLTELRTYRYRTIAGTGTPLARLDADDAPLLTRVPTERGAVYFCATLPTAQFSALEREGVVFYVMLQRALEQGCRTLTRAAQRDAATDALTDRNDWTLVAPVDADAPLLSERGLQAGVYRDDAYWCAINRSAVEDTAIPVPVDRVDTLFDAVSYRRIDADVSDTSALASELWRVFLIAMIVALLTEAALSLPTLRPNPTVPDN